MTTSPLRYVKMPESGESPVAQPYETHTLSLIVKPAGEPVFSEMATIVEIVDEAGGPFVEVKQHGRDGVSTIAIDKTEWPALREAINRMIEACEEIGP